MVDVAGTTDCGTFDRLDVMPAPDMPGVLRVGRSTARKTAAAPRHADQSPKAPLQGPHRERRAATVRRHPYATGQPRSQRSLHRP